MTEAELKEFWEWCGFQHPDKSLAFTNPQEWWLWPNKPNYARMETPTITLDNLFKWAVPKFLTEHGKRP